MEVFKECPYCGGALERHDGTFPYKVPPAIHQSHGLTVVEVPELTWFVCQQCHRELFSAEADQRICDVVVEAMGKIPLEKTFGMRRCSV